MTQSTKSLDKLILTLEERVKELNCLYEVEEVLHDPDKDLQEILNQIVNLIPPAFQHADACKAKIVYRDEEYTSEGFQESPWCLSVDITIQERTIGWIQVCYASEQQESEEGPFLTEERKLLESIATRLGQHLLFLKLKQVFNKWETAKKSISQAKSGEWQVILELLRRTDPDLFIRISRKMLNLLIWKGVEEAEELLQQFNPYARYNEDEVLGESNMPLEKLVFGDINVLSMKIFDVAREHFSDADILTRIQKWMQEDKTSFLVRATANFDTSLDEIYEALRRYYQINPIGMELAPSVKIGVRASLIRRIFTDQLQFIDIAKQYIRVADFYELMKRMIFPTGSHGKLGGKSAGVFLAYRILRASEHFHDTFRNVKTPKTWYLTSDAMILFMHYNNMEEIMEQKYKNIDDVRREYPHVVQLFKNSHFPAEIIKGLSVALDDLGDNPIIVRSSSLLEDRIGSAFSGKYKSLFVANQGSKTERLEALMDAIAEVYASTIAPDPIQYRAERGLLDFHEEMGIMIQSVVGQKIGPYFLPAFAGVAFSNNEFRWSPRIKREDGLIRLVPGLGTRAVDRLSDDYPLLLAPGQPGLRANVSPDEIMRYSPHKIDVVNLNTRRFETMNISDLLHEVGNRYPLIEKLTSIVGHNHFRQPGFNTNFTEADLVFTFEGLLRQTDFIKQIYLIIRELQNKMATPVDIEFAHDGRNLYLLQCRPQSYSKSDIPAAIPANLPKERLLFTANRYISNGLIKDIQYIVYISPDQYTAIDNLDDLRMIGRIVGQLNKKLPKRKFILMGPGRWGSRGDIKLGVNVTYSDINNTGALIEIARKKGNYVPDLSFGTHFFQDLVEASIKYLPLYPDENSVSFNDSFFEQTPNLLNKWLPEYARFNKVVHLIDVSTVSNGLLFHILMNGEENRAVGLLAPADSELLSGEPDKKSSSTLTSEPWQWRMQMAEKIAAQLDADRFQVKEFYVTGSTRKAKAGNGSDIDLLIVLKGRGEKKEALQIWLEGWSLALDEINYLRTGFKSGGLLDVHFITEEELAVSAEARQIMSQLKTDRISPLTLGTAN